MKLTNYNAAVNPFDFYARHSNEAVDYTRGEINIAILSPMNDDVFNEIVKQGSDYVFPSEN